MKTLLLVSFIVFGSISSLQAQTKTATKGAEAPFQGTRKFCSRSRLTTYIVTINGAKVTIRYAYKDYASKLSGTFKKGKVYTTDPNEKNSKTSGRYYQITRDRVRVLNLENGDYEQYDVCR